MDTPLAVSSPGIAGNDTLCGSTISVVAPTSNGALNVDPSSGAFTYSPNPGFTGVDTFTYQLNPPIVPTFKSGSPRGLPSPTATVTITVEPPPCTPVAVDDAYSTPQDVVLNVALPGVKVNDTHCDYFVHLYSNPSNGTLTLNADGTFQYTPNAGFSGVDSFEYALAEIMPGFAGGPRRGVSGWRAPQGAADNVATVTITVSPPPPTTTSTTTTTTTTTPVPTTTTVPPAILPATQ